MSYVVDLRGCYVVFCVCVFLGRRFWCELVEIVGFYVRASCFACFLAGVFFFGLVFFMSLSVKGWFHA